MFIKITAWVRQDTTNNRLTDSRSSKKAWQRYLGLYSVFVCHCFGHSNFMKYQHQVFLRLCSDVISIYFLIYVYICRFVNHNQYPLLISLSLQDAQKPIVNILNITSYDMNSFIGFECSSNFKLPLVISKRKEPRCGNHAPRCFKNTDLINRLATTSECAHYRVIVATISLRDWYICKR